MCRCASMNPGIAVMPLASMVRPLVADGAPAATETIFPARTTIDPRSIAVPLAVMIRALVIVRSCAESDAIAPSVRHVSIVKVGRFIVISPQALLAQQHTLLQSDRADDVGNLVEL